MAHGTGEETALVTPPGPLSERPVDEIRAAQEALEGEDHEPEDAHYAVRLVDGQLTLFEIGHLATIYQGNTVATVTKSKLWQAELDTVQAEIARCGL
jgi:hypothetical protein